MTRAPRSLGVAVAFTAFATTVAAAEPLPRSAQELIELRGELGRRVDVFGTPPWALPTPRHRPAPPPPALVPPPPKPPLLPYAYGGSGRINGRNVLFLEQGHRSLLVGVGDVVDGTYRVEALERHRAVLRYLPLDMAQVMSFGAPEEAVLPARTAAAPRALGPLYVAVPDEAPLDREVPVLLGIPPGSVAAKATIHVTYDENALRITGAKIVRPGKAMVEVSAQDATPSKELRLTALSTQATSTEIGIEVVAIDAQGESLAVRLPAHHISLVEAVN